MLVFPFKKPITLKKRMSPKPQARTPMDKATVKLTELEAGKPARVCKLQGSSVLMGKLKSMGIIPGTLIIKKSAIPAKGPVVVEKGATQFAVGFDMAENIVVEPVKKKALPQK